MTSILLRDEHYNFTRLWSNFIAEMLQQDNHRTISQILARDYRAKICLKNREEYLLFKDPRLATLFALRYSRTHD